MRTAAGNDAFADDMPARPHARQWFTLTRTGIVTSIVYLASLIVYRNGPDAVDRTTRQVIAIISVAALLFLYWRGYRSLTTDRESREIRTVVLFAAVFALIGFLTYPYHSTDVFGYVNRGWQQVHYGMNPYVYALADIPGWQNDPMLREHWLYNPNPYGFLFTLLAWALCRIGNGNWWFTLSLFKFVNVLAFAGTGWLIWSGTKRLGHAGRTKTLYLYLWSPLVLMHCIANGHNDILTGLLVVLALYFAITEKYVWIIPVLTAAALLKYSPGLLVPVAFIYIIRNRGWKPAIWGMLISGLMIAVISFPYLRDWQSIRFADIKDNAALLDNSLHSFVFNIIKNIARLVPILEPQLENIKWAIRTLLSLIFAVFLGWQYLTLPKEIDATLFIRRSLLILMVLLCVATSKLNGWYFAIVLPVALLLTPQDWLRRLTIAISAAQAGSLTFLKQAYIVNYLLMVLGPAAIVARQEMIVSDNPPE